MAASSVWTDVAGVAYDSVTARVPATAAAAGAVRLPRCACLSSVSMGGMPVIRGCFVGLSWCSSVDSKRRLAVVVSLTCAKGAEATATAVATQGPAAAWAGSWLLVCGISRLAEVLGVMLLWLCCAVCGGGEPASWW